MSYSVLYDGKGLYVPTYDHKRATTKENRTMRREPITLGQLADVLRRKDPSLPVYYDFVHFRPEGIHSYRGAYENIALGYGHGKDITVGEVLKMVEDAIGKTFTGYKGGEYDMHSNTPVYVANHNEAGGTAIVDVTEQSWRILLVTESVE